SPDGCIGCKASRTTTLKCIRATSLRGMQWTTTASATRAGQKMEKKPKSDGHLMPGTFPGGGTAVALFSEKCKKRRKPCKRRTKFKRTAYAVSVTEICKKNVRL